MKATKKEHDLAYMAKKKAQGLTKCCVYVPIEDADRLKKYATKLRKAALKAKEQT